MDNGFFGDFFDFDGDGKLDMSEQFMDFMAFQEVMKSTEEDEEEEEEEF